MYSRFNLEIDYLKFKFTMCDVRDEYLIAIFRSDFWKYEGKIACQSGDAGSGGEGRWRSVTRLEAYIVQ